MLNYYSVNTLDPVSQAIDAGVARVFDSLYGNPLLNNPTIIKGLEFVAGVDLLVNHKLNRKVVGYIVINANSAVIVYQSSTVNVAPTAQIILKSNINSTVDILFF